jgi:integral membrane sensor domain MASE1
VITEEAIMFSRVLAVLTVVLLAPVLALAQEQPAVPTPAQQPVSSLMFFTFGAVLLIAVGLFVRFLMSRSNREAANRALNPNHPSNR